MTDFDPFCVDHDRFLLIASAVVDGEATDAEVALFDDHLDGCAACRRFVGDAERLRRRCLVRSVDPASGNPRTAPLISTLRRADRLGVRRLVRRAEASSLVAAILVVTVAFAVAVRAPVASAPTTEAAVATTVHTTNTSFDHHEIDVPVGTSVRWENDGTSRHLLVQQTGKVTVRTALGPTASSDVTFREPGVYRVHCEIHPEMAATVTVTS
ncbi:MAG: cupredoxin domain-containing protein [Acidimicrobiales bacterium]|nr:cupredoxin domain-containing protein [Acidimicrobiales bacterium]